MEEKKIVSVDEIVEMESKGAEEVVDAVAKPVEPVKPKIRWTIQMGKKPQSKKSKICNPRSPLYDPKVAARRKKEKARRKANAKRIARQK